MVKATSDGLKTISFDCFYPDPNINPESSHPCLSDISSILTPDITTVETIEVGILIEIMEAKF